MHSTKLQSIKLQSVKPPFFQLHSEAVSPVADDDIYRENNVRPSIKKYLIVGEIAFDEIGVDGTSLLSASCGSGLTCRRR
jgi:hypothetical protein